MARNYKRDSRGRFARTRAARKAAKNKRLDTTFRKTDHLTTSGQKVSVLTSQRQRRSVRNHAIAGAAVGSVVPGVGTVIGALGGAAVGTSRKKNKPLVVYH